MLNCRNRSSLHPLPRIAGDHHSSRVVGRPRQVHVRTVVLIEVGDVVLAPEPPVKIPDNCQSLTIAAATRMDLSSASPADPR